MKIRKIRCLGARDVTRLLSKLLNERAEELVRLWVSQLNEPSLESLKTKLLDHFLRDKIALVVTMEKLSFMGLPIPLRNLTPAEVACVHTLLTLHSMDPVFRGTVEGYRLRYSEFKYDSLLAQGLDRARFVQMFAEVLLSQAPPETTPRVRNFIRRVCRDEAASFKPRRHPCQQRLEALVGLYQNKKNI